MSILLIEGDPATWTLGANSPADVIQQALISQDGPITVNVETPLKGRLILSTQSATSVAVLMPPPAGWIPGGAVLSRATLYVPTPTGPTDTSHGYTLQASADLAALESDIVTAIEDGTTIAVPVADDVFSGILLLNGSTLSFVVLCPPTAQKDR
jgi:hypothetical protein